MTTGTKQRRPREVMECHGQGRSGWKLQDVGGGRMVVIPKDGPRVPEESGVWRWVVIGIGLLGAVALGVVVYFAALPW